MAAFSNLETFWRHARYGARLLRRNPSYAAVIILTLALGIGANTAIFSVVNSVLLKPLPFKDPNRLVIIWETDTKNRATNSPVSSSDFIDWKDQTRLFEEIAAWRFLYFNLTGKDEPERVQGLTVSPSFLPLLGAQVQLGWSRSSRYIFKLPNRAVFVCLIGSTATWIIPRYSKVQEIRGLWAIFIYSQPCPCNFRARRAPIR
jgi:MacB-like periplasmic core domain